MGDDELEAIKRRMLEQMMSRNSGGESDTGYPSKSVIVTDANLQDTLSRYPFVVLDCWAPWCGPCRMVAPTIDRLAKDLAGRVVFGKLNVDENHRTAAAYGIRSIPTLLFFKNGHLADRVVGALPYPHLRRAIEKHL
ncbi:MAG: thioredoxin [Thermoplasmata archaeon]|nr:thioredoxin [Thermoplasmata archaeon]